MLSRVILIFCCLALGRVAAQQVELPPAPKGFSYRYFKAHDFAILVPDGWFVVDSFNQYGGRLIISEKKVPENMHVEHMPPYCLIHITCADGADTVDDTPYYRTFRSRVAESMASGDLLYYRVSPPYNAYSRYDLQEKNNPGFGWVMGGWVLLSPAAKNRWFGQHKGEVFSIEGKFCAPQSDWKRIGAIGQRVMESFVLNPPPSPGSHN